MTDTAVSFEYEVPSVEEFAYRIKKIKEKYPYLVCVYGDKIIGYAYAGKYITGCPYEGSREEI